MNVFQIFSRRVSVVCLLGLALCGCPMAPGVGDGSIGDGTMTDGSTGGSSDGSSGGDGASTATLVVFSDPDSDFTTTDVYDVDNEVMQFDSIAKSIIWGADGMMYDEGLWEVTGNVLSTSGVFQVRYGNFEGQRRAYFTETGSGTICNLSVPDTTLMIVSTSTPVPQ